ncbi:hypothetical protein GpartN1_g6146.t1 [Galdieria partita]|uniref:Uncharacterized protein n=1 Tax=Galdieria partita TaxID=83374 RepID=A0A9C7Q1V5_9RHOD|nr:hypothetical protein GpartN1_g6146.t1 [Galdieria partita]
MLFLTVESVNLYPKPNKLSVVDKNNLFHWSRRQCRRTPYTVCFRCQASLTNQTNQLLHSVPFYVLLSDTTDSTLNNSPPVGLPPEPAVWEKYLISGAFVLGIVVTLGVVFLTLAEWRDRTLKKEAITPLEKGEKQSQEQSTPMNRFARRLKKKEEKLKARRKL